MAAPAVPLYPAEQQAPKSRVCVTGASGYIAGAIVQRLLLAGHTVHGTVRNPEDGQATAHLAALPGAAQRLRLFAADLMSPSSFDEPVKGCDFVVHTASPVVLNAPPGREREVLIEPAVQGTRAVLGAVGRAPSVKRVVLTSSVAAIVGDLEERGKGHVYSDADWPLDVTETNLPYNCSKTSAEKAAWELQRQQNRWDLCTVNPGVVIGAPLAKRHVSGSLGLFRDIFSGKYWPFAPPAGMTFVHVDDVAAAHCLALFKGKPGSRYIMVERSGWPMDLANALRPKFGARYWLPRVGWLPKWVALRAAASRGIRADVIHARFGKVAQFDCSKAQQELGIRFTPMAEAAVQTAEALIKMGMV